MNRIKYTLPNKIGSKIIAEDVKLFLAGFCIAHTQGFNVGTAEAKIFTGLAVEEFGYTVRQLSNNQGKW